MITVNQICLAKKASIRSTVVEAAAVKEADKRNKLVIFQHFASFIIAIKEKKNTHVDNTRRCLFIDTNLPSDNYSKALYYRKKQRKHKTF